MPEFEIVRELPQYRAFNKMVKILKRREEAAKDKQYLDEIRKV